MLEVQDLCYGIQQKRILDRISFHVITGETLGIIGPNGSGKSTLLKLLSRLYSPDEGKIMLQGKPLSFYSGRKLARKVAVVTQEGISPLPITVQEAVEMGRYPYHSFWTKESIEDSLIVERVLEQTRLLELKEKPLDELSGGERQRVAIACSFSQEPELLLLDEPTTFLDIGYQLAILNMVKSWQQETKGTAIMVLHDLNLAAQYCDRLLLMEKGKMIHIGHVEEIIESELLSGVYGTRPIVINHPNLGIPQILLADKTV
jgi:iron complex transport system ATP-binding protein